MIDWEFGGKDIFIDKDRMMREQTEFKYKEWRKYVHDDKDGHKVCIFHSTQALSVIEENEASAWRKILEQCDTARATYAALSDEVSEMLELLQNNTQETNNE